MRRSKSETWRPGVWGSGMSPAQHTALRTTGFTPVGVVAAISVQKANEENIDFCARAWSSVASPSSDPRRSPAGRAAGFRPRPIPVSPKLMDVILAPSTAMDMVLRDLRTNCRNLGANGVLDLVIETTPSTDHRTIRYRATGTAVRAPDGTGWFTAHLSGSEFAKLRQAGWTPVSLIIGAAVGLRHEVRPRSRRRLNAAAAARNSIEVETWTDVMQRTRAQARSDLNSRLHAVLNDEDAFGRVDVDGEGDEVDGARARSGIGVGGALLASETTHTWLRSCPNGRGKDRMVHTTLMATAVTEYVPEDQGAESLARTSTMSTISALDSWRNPPWRRGAAATTPG